MAYYLPITEHQRKKAVEAAAAAIAARLGTVPKSAAQQAAAIAASPGRFLAPKSAPIRPAAARPRVPKFQIDSQNQASTEPVDAGRAKKRSRPPCAGTARELAYAKSMSWHEIDEVGWVLPRSLTTDVNANAQMELDKIEAQGHRELVHWCKRFMDWKTDQEAETAEDLRYFRTDYLHDFRCIGTSAAIQKRIDHGEELPRAAPSEAWKWPDSPDHSDTDTGEENAAAPVAKVDEELFDVFAG